MTKTYNSIGNSIGHYENVINANPILNKEEEESLFKEMTNSTKEKKKIAREKIINSNIKLAIKEAIHYSKNSNVPVEDLIGAGIEGLCIAIDRFDPSKYKNRLSTYSVPWIKVKIIRLINSFNSTVYIPINVLCQSRNLKKSKVTSDEELMKELNVSKKGLYNVRSAQTNFVSLNETKYNDSDEYSMSDLIPDNKAVTSEVALEGKETREKILKEIEKLDPVSIAILKRRYLSDTKEDLHEIGNDYNITGERVRQIEFKALKLLRRRMKNRSFFGV